jgi:hypothetical protein
VILASLGYNEAIDGDEVKEFRRKLLEQAKVQDEKALILEVKG